MLVLWMELADMVCFYSCEYAIVSKMELFLAEEKEIVKGMNPVCGCGLAQLSINKVGGKATK